MRAGDGAPGPCILTPVRRRPLLARLALVGLALVGCAGRGATRGADPTPDRGPLLLYFERAGCYGFCPVYWIRVADDGAMVYEGAHFVATLGRSEARLGADQVAALRQAIAGADFFTLADRYDDVRYPELPSMVITVRDHERRKTVYHHLGDVSAPGRLLELEEAIDRIVGIDAFIGSDAERDRLSGS